MRKLEPFKNESLFFVLESESSRLALIASEMKMRTTREKKIYIGEKCRLLIRYFYLTSVLSEHSPETRLLMLSRRIGGCYDLL